MGAVGEANQPSAAVYRAARPRPRAAHRLCSRPARPGGRRARCCAGCRRGCLAPSAPAARRPSHPRSTKPLSAAGSSMPRTGRRSPRAGAGGHVVWESLDAAQVAGTLRMRAITSASRRAFRWIRAAHRRGGGAACRSAQPGGPKRRRACCCMWCRATPSVEISHTLQIAPDAVRKRLSRAMQRLRAAYFAQEVRRAAISAFEWVGERAARPSPRCDTEGGGSMNSDSVTPPGPTPGPFCALVDAQLSLLALGELEPEEARLRRPSIWRAARGASSGCASMRRCMRRIHRTYAPPLPDASPRGFSGGRSHA